MQEPLVSIIVPAYNSEKYIERCITSILNQTYKNIEIIVVNDGSKDKTLNILQNLQTQYKNKITIINQSNKGSGPARNEGIKNVNGQYFTFVDSDDALKDNAIDDFINLVDDKTDIIISGFESIDNKTNSKKTIVHLPEKISLWTELKYPCTAFKFYKTNYIKNKKIYFESTKLLEDVTFNVWAFSETDNIKILSKCNYINYLNNDSMTANITKNQSSDISIALTSLIQHSNTTKYPSNMFMFFCIKTAVQNVLMQLNYLNTKSLINLFNKYWDIISKYFEVKAYKQKDEAKLINFIVNSFVVSKKTHTTKILIRCLKLTKINV